MLAHDFMVRALLLALAVAVMAAPVGVFLTVRRMAPLADTMSHVALVGVGAALLAGVAPSLGITAAAVLGAVGVEAVRARTRVFSDTALAIFYAAGLALALVLLRLAGGLNADLFGYLFGSLLAVTPADVLRTWLLALGVLATVAALGRYWYLVSLDEELAASSGLPVGRLGVLFAALAGLVVGAAMQVAGVLLVGGLLVIPAAASLQVARSFRGAVAWAELFALAAGGTGLWLSYVLDLPPGGAIVLTALGLFLLAAAAGRAAE